MNKEEIILKSLLIIIPIIVIVIVIFLFKNKFIEFFSSESIHVDNNINNPIDDSSIIISGKKIGEPDLIIEKQEPNNIPLLKKINDNIKIPFIIEEIDGDYKINLPDYNDFNFMGRGIVIAGSGTSYRYVTGIFTNIYLIRKIHNSNIPIEIFYVGKEEEFPYDIKTSILSFGGVTFVNLLDRINIGIKENDFYNYEYNQDKINELRGYQTKPLACLCSSFAEIVLMDADAISFIDPSFLFDIKGYSSSGMVLFRDYVKCLSFVSKDFINKIGITDTKFCNKTGGMEIDSSCIILNKEKAWEALYTICFINIKSDQYYRHKKSKFIQTKNNNIIEFDNVLGDKDTWLIGSIFVGFDPYIDKSIEPTKLSVLNENNIYEKIDGHYQRGYLKVNGVSDIIPIYYNNQKLKIEGLTLENINKIQHNNRPLPDNVIKSFLGAKDAYQLIDNILPYELLSQKPPSTDFFYYSMIP